MSLTQVPASMLANSGYELGMRNRIINGAMQVWQRGTTYALTTAPAYGSIDRWVAYQGSSANGVANQVALGTNGFQYALKLGRNSGATTTGPIVVAQAIATANSVSMAGQPVTLSLYAKAGANFSGGTLNIVLYSGTGTDQSVVSMVSATWTGYTTPISNIVTPTTTLTRYSATVTLPANVTQLGCSVYYTPTGTAGADDNVYITGVQLEIGSTATPFEFRPYSAEFALCQLYFISSYPDGVAINGNAGALSGANFTAVSASDCAGANTYPVRMRATPTITIYAPGGGSGAGTVRNAASGAVVSSVTTTSDANQFAFNRITGVFTSGVVYSCQYTASAEL